MNSFRQELRRFGKAVFAGTAFVGGPCCLLVSAGVLLGQFGPLSAGPELPDLLFLAVSPIWVAFSFVLVGSLCIGFPTRLILRRMGKESRDAYTRIGCIAGLLMPLAIPLTFNVPGRLLLFLCLAGGGTTTAQAWWKGRPNEGSPV